MLTPFDRNRTLADISSFYIAKRMAAFVLIPGNQAETYLPFRVRFVLQAFLNGLIQARNMDGCRCPRFHFPDSVAAFECFATELHLLTLTYETHKNFSLTIILNVEKLSSNRIGK